MSSAKSTRDVLIQTEKLAEASVFYEKTLGLEMFCREPTIIGLETGAFRLFLESGPTYGPVLEFLVDDVQAKKAELVAAGCTVEQEDPSVPRCYIRDPYGLIFNIGKR